MLSSNSVFLLVFFNLNLLTIVVISEESNQAAGEEGQGRDVSATDSDGIVIDSKDDQDSGTDGSSRVTRLTFDGAGGSARICSRFNKGSCYPAGKTDCDRREFILRMTFLTPSRYALYFDF